MDTNLSYVSASSRDNAVDFGEVAEEAGRIADQTGRRLDVFFARFAQEERRIGEEFIASLDREVGQWLEKIVGLEAELAQAWESLGRADKALQDARRTVAGKPRYKEEIVFGRLLDKFVRLASRPFTLRIIEGHRKSCKLLAK